MRVHLIPFLGTEAGCDHESRHPGAEARLEGRSAKTLQQHVDVPEHAAEESRRMGVLEMMPCTIELLKLPEGYAVVLRFRGVRKRSVSEAAQDWRAYLIVLLGGEAGLRLGEMLALEWSDIDFQLGHVVIARSEWKGIVGATKGGRSRPVELTRRLSAALRKHRTCGTGGCSFKAIARRCTMKTIQTGDERAARRADVKPGVHILRHTFCSHLAMKGAVPRQIQELAGHKDLSTTMRYMHLSPLSRRQAIQLLDAAVSGKHTGNGLEKVGNSQIP